MKLISQRVLSIGLTALLCSGLVPFTSTTSTEKAWAAEAENDQPYQSTYPATALTLGSLESKMFWGESVFEVHSFDFTLPRDMEVEIYMSFWAISCSHGHFSVDLVNDAGEKTELVFYLGAMDPTTRTITQKLAKGDYHLEVTYSQSHKNQMGSFGVSVDEKKPNITAPTTQKPKPTSGFKMGKSKIKVAWSEGFTNNFKNTSGGKITHKSSNKKVATIDSKGLVTYKGIGETVITNTQAETSKYAKSSASWTLIIVPDKPVVKSVIAGKKSFTVKWKKQSKKYSSGYQIRYSTSKSMKKATTKTVSGASKSSVKIKKLKAGKKYYVQVRVFKKTGGKTYYSSWSSKKTVKVKK